MTLELDQNWFFFAAVVDVVVTDVDVVEVDVVADTEYSVGSGWYAAEGIGLELELK